MLATHVTLLLLSDRDLWSFGQVESRDEAMAVSVESKTMGDSDGEPNMDGDGTVSSGNTDLM